MRRRSRRAGPDGADGVGLGRALVAVALVVAAVAAVASFASGAVAQISFEPTEASRFRAWAARPAVTAGVIAVACCTAGLIGWFLARRRRPRTLAGPALAAVAAIAVLAWGNSARAGRSHPEAARARALASLVMPGGYTPLAPQVDHASVVTAPAATRTWRAPAGSPACGDLHDRLTAWADPRTVRGAPGNTATRCYWSATWHRHQVDANVVPGGDGTTVSVRLAG